VQHTKNKLSKKMWHDRQQQHSPSFSGTGAFKCVSGLTTMKCNAGGEPLQQPSSYVTGAYNCSGGWTINQQCATIMNHLTTKV
jgi:hypothetical protein